MKITTTPYPKYRKAEMVERKCPGHPDSLSDGIAESVSRALSREYRREHGKIHHHNVDKVGLVAGNSRTKWGGGTVVKPIRIIIAGRAHYSVPVETVAIKAARDYIRSVLTHAEDEHFIIDPMIGEGAAELMGTVDQVVANDTSIGVGFAPLTDTEQLTLDIGDFLTSKKFVEEWPMAGPDIKVMTHSNGGEVDVTIAMAFIDRYLENMHAYEESKAGILSAVRDHFGLLDSQAEINTLDGSTKDSLFLTVIGTSAEQGDDGATGRGNRINGLITPARPMSLEAACGKNPVSHVGKLYNVLAQKIADRLHAETGKPAEVLIQSRIGRPITDPPMVIVRTDATGIEASVKDEVARIPGLTDEIVSGGCRLF
jgi:S-adenosylmethionine synthetase